MFRKSILAALLLGLVVSIAGCGDAKYEAKTEGDAQTQYIKPGEPMKMPNPGAPK